MKMKKIKLKKDIKPHCLRCGYLDVDVLSTGEIICHNPKCLAITRYDFEKNQVDIKFNVDNN